MIVPTVLGDLDEDQLEKREYMENGFQVREYYFEGRLVHRSVVAAIRGVAGSADAAEFG